MRFLGRVYSGRNMMAMWLKEENIMRTMRVISAPSDTPYLAKLQLNRIEIKEFLI